jgi:hypothetical protein
LTNTLPIRQLSLVLVQIVDDTIGRATHLQMRAHALVDLGRVSLYPTKDSRVIYMEPALSHHLFDIAVR